MCLTHTGLKGLERPGPFTGAARAVTGRCLFVHQDDGHVDVKPQAGASNQQGEMNELIEELRKRRVEL